MSETEVAGTSTLSKSPEDQAAEEFQGLLPVFEKKLEELSNRQLKRVVMAWFRYPLIDQHPHLPYQHEKELFVYGIRLRDCMFTFMDAILRMSTAQQKELVEEVNQKLGGESADNSTEGK